MQAKIKTIIIKCPRCGSDRIVLMHTDTAAVSVNYKQEYRCLNCGLRFDGKIPPSAAAGKN